MMRGEVYQEEEVHDMAGFGDEDDEEDALSFCDLPIYYGRDDAQKESTTDHASSRSNNQSSSISSSTNYNEDENDDDCFDFSFTSSQSQQEKNIIIFCGKIIKRHRKEESPILPNINSDYYCKKLQLLKGSNKSTKGMPEKKKTCHSRKNNSTASAKYNKNKKSSKWYMLMLGLVRIHQGGKMELNDIKKRQQTKRSYSRRLEIANSNKSGSSGDIEMMKSGINSKAGLLSLLRSFSCTRIPTDDVEYCKVKASLWYLQRLRAAH